MHKLIMIFAIAATMLLAACDFFKSDFDRFTDTYRKVLINTEIYSADSVKAHKELLKILDESGYTLQSFQDQFIQISKEDPEKFTKTLDTMRESIAKEIIEIRNKH